MTDSLKKILGEYLRRQINDGNMNWEVAEEIVLLTSGLEDGLISEMLIKYPEMQDFLDSLKKEENE